MAYSIQGKVIVRPEGTVISTGAEEYIAPDGSVHMVPVVNSSALQQLQEYASDEEASAAEDLTPAAEEGGEKTDVKNNYLKLFSSNEDLLNFLVEREILHGSYRCIDCRCECKAREKKGLSDEFVWQCSQCRRQYSVRSDSIFAKSKLSIQTIMQIILYWASGAPGHTTCNLLRDVSANTIYKWYKVCRDKVHAKMQTEKIKFTGDGVTAEVQIDESLCGKKRKYNRGKFFSQVWLFGISQLSEHKCILVPVEKRDEATLMKIIEEHVDKSCNMKVVSDGWSSYKNLALAGYQHSVVIHKNEFVNDQGDHTNSIESIWLQLKSWMSSMHGVDKSSFEEYLSELMFRYNYCGGSRADCFEQFLQELRIDSQG